MLIKGTGLTLGVGCEGLVPASHFLQMSQPQSRPEREVLGETGGKATSSVICLLTLTTGGPGGEMMTA